MTSRQGAEDRYGKSFHNLMLGEYTVTSKGGPPYSFHLYKTSEGTPVQLEFFSSEASEAAAEAWKTILPHRMKQEIASAVYVIKYGLGKDPEITAESSPVQDVTALDISKSIYSVLVGLHNDVVENKAAAEKAEKTATEASKSLSADIATLRLATTNDSIDIRYTFT